MFVCDVYLQLNWLQTTAHRHFYLTNSWAHKPEVLGLSPPQVGFWV